MTFVPDVPVLQITPEAVTKLFVEVTEALTGYGPGRVLVETKADRRPQDKAPYATLWFKLMEPLPQNEGDWYYESLEYDNNEQAAQVLDNETLCTLQFGFWGDDAYHEAIKLMHALQNANRQFDLWRIVGFAGFDSVQDISVQYGAKIQQRAYFNMDFYVCFGRCYDVDWFKVSNWNLTDINTANSKYSQQFLYSKEEQDKIDPRCVSGQPF